MRNSPDGCVPARTVLFQWRQESVHRKQRRQIDGPPFQRSTGTVVVEHGAGRDPVRPL
jgi:hypothetical protein